MRKIITLSLSSRLKILALLFSFASHSLWAQDGNAFLQFRFMDSIEAESSQGFIRNNLTITNIYRYNLKFTVNLGIPEGYSLISRNDVPIELAPGEVYILPLTLSMEKTTPSDKRDVSISVKINNPSTFLRYKFSVQSKEYKSLRIIPLQTGFQVSKDKRVVRLSLKIKNIGNATDDFYVYYKNKNLLIDKKIKLSLPPFRDTLVSYDYVIPLGLLQGMVTETIVVNVGNDINFQSVRFTLSKIRNTNIQNHSAYRTMPLTLETGFFMNNNELSYFWGVSGALFINNNNSLSFDYRSKQFGADATQNNFLSVFYKYKKWDFNLGQMSDSKNFSVNGLGFQVNHQKNEEEGLSMTAISNLGSGQLYDNSQGFVAETNYYIGDFFWNGVFEVNQNSASNINSSIFSNKLDILRKPKLNLGIILGTGFEQHTHAENRKPIWGYSYGYNFNFNSDKWSIVSTALLNNNDYPGIYKGWRSIEQSVDYRIVRPLSVGVFYNSNFTKQNYFIDSIYYDNRFLYNLTNYGIKLNWSRNAVSLSLGGGESQASGPLLLNSLPRYHSVFGGVGFHMGSFARLTFNSTVNFNTDYGIEHKAVTYYVNNVSFISKYGGVNFYITRMPTISGSFDGNFLNGYRNSINVGPYINMRFFRNRLNGRLQYNFYRTTEYSKKSETQTLLGSLAYIDPKKNIEVQLYGNYALQSTQGVSSFASLSIRKTFNVPILTSRKFYDLNLVLYEDVNGDGKMESSDTLLSDLMVNINSMSFISNKRGVINYKNVEKGVYHLNFHNMKSRKGLIPTQGFSQAIVVNGQTTIYIPFNKGKVIKGVVGITLDAISSNSFTVGQLKVTAIDSMGNQFTTFTDDDGSYELNVPAGNYIVSLNPDAFDDVFKPTQMSFNVDMLHNETFTVTFHIKQKSRKINRIKADID